MWFVLSAVNIHFQITMITIYVNTADEKMKIIMKLEEQMN